MIDGQQRLTTLLVLHQFLGIEIPTECIFKFHNSNSVHNIRLAQVFFKNNIIESEKEQLKQLFTKLEFTLITTQNQDDAFIFFDTQNSRGVKLKATELLKAHHLRVVSGVDAQEDAAKRWEHLETLRIAYGKTNDKHNGRYLIDELFDHYLYYARTWVGKKTEFIKNGHATRRDAFMDEFGAQTLLQESTSNGTRLYPHAQNTYIHSIEVGLDTQSKGEYIPEFRYKNLRHTPLSIPFSIRQPIDKGMGYFLFVEKYAKILELLFNHSDNRLLEFDELNLQVVFSPKMSEYARRFYLLCVICYYDKFEEKDLFKFALYLEFLIGSVRISQARLSENSLTNAYFRDSKVNLLDMILHAFTTDQLFSQLNPLIEKANVNYKESSPSEGIRAAYIKLTSDYYGKTDVKIVNKLTWLKEKTGYL